MRHDIFTARRIGGGLLLAFGLLLPGTSTLLAGGIPSDNVMRGFIPTSEYDVVVAGKTVPSAEVYQNTTIPAILVLSTSLSSPVLLTPRAGKVESVHIMKVAKKADGTVDLLADAVLSPLGAFRMDGESVAFTVDKKPVSLKPRPAVIGNRRNADLKVAIPEYARGAQNYTPNATAIAALKKETDAVVVRIFFGSWCPHCREHVPLLLKVEDEVKNPKIQFQYYGLPRDFNDPEAKKLEIKSVPTGIVYIGGREVGRLSGAGWNNPEVLLSKILASPAAQVKNAGK